MLRQSPKLRVVEHSSAPAPGGLPGIMRFLARVTPRRIRREMIVKS